MKNNWGIIGAGRIAGSLASVLSQDGQTVLKAVASKNEARGAAFVKTWGAGKLYSGEQAYADLIADSEIDIVYIATPHVSHAELSIAAMKAGKAVVCEKPAAVNAADLRRVLAVSKETGMFFMEAVWSKFHPAFRLAMEWIRAGKIGDVRLIHADFCINRPNAPKYTDTGYATHRLYDMNLAGGALLDAGIYPVTLAVNAAAAALRISPHLAVPTKIVSDAKLSPEGVDVAESVILRFGSGIRAHLNCSIETECGTDLKYARICGTKGTLRMEEFWYCRHLDIVAEDGTVTESADLPFDINGYEYEVREVNEIVLGNRAQKPERPVIESRLHTHADSLAVLLILDALRAQWNLVYPFEKKTGTGNSAAADASAVSAAVPDGGTVSVGRPGSEAAPSGKADGGAITVYTDGACSGNPGKGGWGAVILADGAELQLNGGELSTTNNRMELTAAIQALSKISQTPAWASRRISVHIDSQYVKNGITSWIASWKRNGWKTANKAPVKNRDLWMMLDALNAKLDVEWKWVKGHAGNTYNELCDTLATAFQKNN